MNKQRLIITSVISIFLCATLLVGSTYSIFTSQEIDENTNVYTTGNLNITYTPDTIKFTDITPMTEKEADGVTPYRITVTNKGNVPYMFDVILIDTTSSKENTIDYQYIMTKVGYLEAKALSNCDISELGDKNIIIKEDVILPAGESVDIDVRIWLSDKVQNTDIGKSFYSKLTIDGLAVYDDNKEINNDLLSLRYMKTSSANDFRSDTYLTYIKNASFVNYIDTSNAVEYWDMTTNTDVNKNKVIAWVEDNGTTDENGNKYYDLYIGSKEKIYAKKLQSFFSEMTSLESIIFDNLDTSLTTMMGDFGGGMFKNCSSLTNLDLSSFDTSNVVDMEAMFLNCSSLVNLDLSSFDTSKVTSMGVTYKDSNGGMFQNCSSLTNLDLSNFDTSNVTNMNKMFFGCKSLTSLDVSKFNTNKVTIMYAMFSGCSSLIELDLSNFDTSNVTDMQRMFFSCNSLTELDVSNFNTSNVTDMRSMFEDCINLTSLDLGSFNTSNVKYMGATWSNAVSGMFQNCSSLTELDLSNFDTSNVVNMEAMFYGCSSLLKLEISNFDTSKVTAMNHMFFRCDDLTTTLTIRNSSTTYTSMFYNAATAEGALITVNYIVDNTTTTDINESTETLVDSMIATKSSNSNVAKGTLVE